MGGQLLSRQLHHRLGLPVACFFLAHGDTACVSTFIILVIALSLSALVSFRQRNLVRKHSVSYLLLISFNFL